MGVKLGDSACTVILVWGLLEIIIIMLVLVIALFSSAASVPLASRNNDEFLKRRDTEEFRTLYRRDTDSMKRRETQESFYGRRSAQTTFNDYEYDTGDQVAVETSNVQPQSKASASVIARILAAAGAKPTPVDPSGSYSGKRKRATDNTDYDEADSEDQIAVESTHPLQNKVSASDIARILAIAGAKPSPVDPADISYAGKRKRSAEGDIIGEFEPLVDAVPVAAVKVKPHSSNGNIVQQYNGDSAYQNTVHSSRFGRNKREDFIPFHVYDDRRVKTLKVEQNDFLALNSKAVPKPNNVKVKRNHIPKA